jgi:hypothetical protein
LRCATGRQRSQQFLSASSDDPSVAVTRLPQDVKRSAKFNAHCALRIAHLEACHPEPAASPRVKDHLAMGDRKAALAAFPTNSAK